MTCYGFVHEYIGLFRSLTLSVGPRELFNPFKHSDANGWTSKRSGPHWSNPLLLVFHIQELWRPGLSPRVPECQKIENGGLYQYAA